jgi:hypothetical protein
MLFGEHLRNLPVDILVRRGRGSVCDRVEELLLGPR